MVTLDNVLSLLLCAFEHIVWKMRFINELLLFIIIIIIIIIIVVVVVVIIIIIIIIIIITFTETY